MKVRTAIIFLVAALVLASCTTATTSVTPVSTIASASATAEVASTMTPSPMPAIPPFSVITPNATQVERWKEYQIALAKKLMAFLPLGQVLCEWEILGQSSQEVYVWALCASTAPIGNSGFYSEVEEPAVIHVLADGSIQSIEIPGAGTDYAVDIHRLFPSDVQAKIFGNLINYQQLSDHLNWRRQHSDQPPLVVLLATQTP